MFTPNDVLRGKRTTDGFVEYFPDKKEYVFREEDTGWPYLQDAKTEELVWYHIGKINGKHCIISLKETYFQLCLKGEIDYSKAVAAINQYCRVCYSNEALGWQATAMTVEVWEKLPKYLQRRWCWLGSEEKKDSKSGIWGVWGNEKRIKSFSNIYGYDCADNMAISPIILI